MSDTLETSRLVRIIRTPLGDLVRGRLRSEPNWKQRIAASNLPASAADLIRRVVAGTRLWWNERADVADELIAHFTDGLAAGASVEALVHDFGDERAASGLIRRAKRRNRSLFWHAKKWTFRGLLALVALYGIIVVRFLIGTPSIRVDYLAKFNASTMQLKEDDRAWPLYRKAMLSLGVAPEKGKEDEGYLRRIEEKKAGDRSLIDATPADAEWPELKAWLAAHNEDLTLLRTAAEKPATGFLYGEDGAQVDAALGWNASAVVDQPLLRGSMISVILPNLHYVRELAKILRADLHVARDEGDAARVVADLNAIFDLGRHQNEPFIVSRLVGIAIYGIGLDELRKIVETRPSLLSDAQLIALAHRTASIGGETASSLIDLAGERMCYYDILQRMYTDDGNGDGRVTVDGVREISQINVSEWGRTRTNPATLAAVGSVLSAVASRRDALAEYDRLMDLNERLIARPLRDALNEDGVRSEADRRFRRIQTSVTETARFFPLTTFYPSLTRAYWSAEKLLAERDGVVIGIALELYRRQHGAYPNTLDALAPAYLPKLPVDTITGMPLHYTSIAGWPVVYSVGADRDDDGGRLPIENGELHPERAAELERTDKLSIPQRARQDGDWILFGEEAAGEATLSKWRATTRPAS